MENESCTICGEAGSTANDGEYFRCGWCGAIRTKYGYDGSIYGDSYAQTYLQYTTTPTNIPLNLFRLGLVSRWLKKNSKILDVGCCVGEFLKYAEQFYRCFGYEPNRAAADLAVNRVIHTPVKTELDGWHLGYDCITMFDVIEHIENPADFLAGLVGILKPRGIIVITTPNADCLPMDDKSVRQWKHWKPREHLYIHTENSLRNLFEKFGLHAIHIGREESDIRPGNPNGDLLTCVARKEND